MRYYFLYIMVKSYKTIVITGPSAVGKTYLADKIHGLYPEIFTNARLYTTRKARPNQQETDRIFIEKSDFDNKVKTKKILIHGEFGNNLYGYSKEALIPTTKNILVNTWPGLLPQFKTTDKLILIGLQAPSDWLTILTQRMKDRGDNKKTIIKRLRLIRKDTRDLETNRKLIENKGKLFTIKDNSTIEEEVIPWLVKELGLQA